LGAGADGRDEGGKERKADDKTGVERGGGEEKDNGGVKKEDGEEDHEDQGVEAPAGAGGEGFSGGAAAVEDRRVGALVEDGEGGVGGAGGAGATGSTDTAGIETEGIESINGAGGAVEAPGDAERDHGAKWSEDGAQGTNAHIAFYALSQNLLDISVAWRVILAQPCPQPHDPPAHAERLQKCPQLTIHSLFVELAGIGAGCLEAFSRQHTE